MDDGKFVHSPLPHGAVGGVSVGMNQCLQLELDA